jgi:hypothetical protein
MYEVMKGFPQKNVWVLLFLYANIILRQIHKENDESLV